MKLQNIFRFICLPAIAFLFHFNANAAPTVKVGSKKFTESVILGDLATLHLAHLGLKTQHRAELGGSRILWNALLAGDIDIYPEYTGTLEKEILQKEFGSFEALKLALHEKGIGITSPLGFNNTYALGMKREKAKQLGIEKISDLVNHPNLNIGVGEEFRKRSDGWVGLKVAYKLPHKFVRGLDHDIAYRALESDDILLTDLYSTDAEIEYYDLLSLKDDLDFFPRYDAVYLYRLAKAEEAPEIKEGLDYFSGQIDEDSMRNLNLKAKVEGIPSKKVAAQFLGGLLETKIVSKVATRTERVLLRSNEHFKLVAISLFAAILCAIPLGVLASKFVNFGRALLWTVGAIQTIPALALLVVLIKPLNLLGFSGIGDTPALIALFLYSLLPIVRNTHSGFEQIPISLRETSSVLGLSAKTRLLKIEFPLALPSILSGIKTAAVLNIGFATLGALVGAGGYGQPILTGIRLDNYGLILEGALPAAVMALLIQWFFDFIEKQIVSPGLR